MSAPAAIRTHNLSKHFGRVRAVHELDLSVRRGEIFGFLGPNGAGKTTTIRMLLDFVRPSGGRAEVLGGTGADPAIRRRVGYLPAELRFPEGYCGGELIELFADLRGGVDRARTAALVERLDADLTRPLAQLSTGNRRKVGIVQAFMHAPELLILDEPTSGLDPLLQHEFHGLVRDAVEGGATVFISSHVLPEVERIADRVGILRAGELVAVATIDELRQRARQRLTMHSSASAAEIAAAADRLRALERVGEVTARDGVLEVVVQGSVDAVLKVVAQLDVDRIVSHDDELEDIFLAFYRDDDHAAEASR